MKKLFLSILMLLSPIVAQAQPGIQRQAESYWFPGDLKVYFGNFPNASLNYTGGNLVIDILSGGGKVSFPDGIIAAITGNATTATALSANPTDCSSNQFATTIAANGNLTCAAITDAAVPDALTISGGTVNGSAIGGVTPAAGSFTTLGASGAVTFTSATNIGWSVVAGANTACNTTCTNACVFGQNTADMSIVDCAATTADVCVCAGSN